MSKNEKVLILAAGAGIVLYALLRAKKTAGAQPVYHPPPERPADSMPPVISESGPVETDTSAAVADAVWQERLQNLRAIEAIKKQLALFYAVPEPMRDDGMKLTIKSLEMSLAQLRADTLVGGSASDY